MLHYYVFPVSDEMLIPNTTIPSVHLTYLVWNVRIHTRLASHAMHRSRRCQINVPTKGPMEVTVNVAAWLLGLESDRSKDDGLQGYSRLQCH